VMPTTPALPALPSHSPSREPKDYVQEVLPRRVKSADPSARPVDCCPSRFIVRSFLMRPCGRQPKDQHTTLSAPHGDRPQATGRGQNGGSKSHGPATPRIPSCGGAFGTSGTHIARAQACIQHERKRTEAPQFLQHRPRGWWRHRRPASAARAAKDTRAARLSRPVPAAALLRRPAASAAASQLQAASQRPAAAAAAASGAPSRRESSCNPPRARPRPRRRSWWCWRSASRHCAAAGRRQSV
jgi:hypothetical protein